MGYKTLTTVPKKPSEGALALAERKAGEQAALGAYGTIDADKGHYKVPIERAMEMVVEKPSALEPAVIVKADLDEMSPMERGEHLFHKSVHACGACHSVDGSKKQAPTLLGRFGQPAELSDGTASPFDRAYVVESLNAPKAKLAKGYDPSKVAGAVEMPSFAGKISDQELTDLIAYLQSL